MRNNKSDLNKKNHILNPNSLCKTCNKCLISGNHDKCIEKFLKSFKKPPAKKVWRARQIKQSWKPIGKMFTNVGFQSKSTGRIFILGEHCPLTRITMPRVVHVKEWKPTDRIILLDTKCPLTRSIASTSVAPVVKTKAPMVLATPEIVCTNQLEPNLNWGSGTPNSLLSFVFKCRSYRTSFGIWTQAAHNIWGKTNDVWMHQFKPRSSMSTKWCQQTTLQAPFLKEKKGLHFSALYLWKKRNHLIYDHSHQQASCFSHAHSVIKWINVHWSIFLFTCSIKNGSHMQFLRGRSVNKLNISHHVDQRTLEYILIHLFNQKWQSSSVNKLNVSHQVDLLTVDCILIHSFNQKW